MDPLLKLIDLEKEIRAYGFNWPDMKSILDQVFSEIQEVKDEIVKDSSGGGIQEEMGDLLHAVISLILFAGYDVNETLQKIHDKFLIRTNRLRAIASKQGLLDLKNQNPSVLADLWHLVKMEEKG
ncbi:MAG: MazG nucleotide pyrophosphohydrolase domain-containing protein [Rhabdochlamydiaceae bacterium]